MNTEERVKKQKELIEELGRHFDKEGFQPIAGRILGLLMVMDKEQFTFDEIIEELQISKSSASNALRNLEIRGSIEYVTIPCDRKRYFQLKKRDTFSIIDEFEKKTEGFKDFLSKILALKADKNSSNASYYERLIDMMNFFLERIESLKADYEEKRIK